MKTLLLTSISVLTLASASTAQPQSLWDHNGSLMSLAANGANRQFYYDQPRPGVVQAGVRPGTLYFDGVTNGRQYTGTAYVFSTRCGATGFAAAGPVSPDGRQVTLYGQSPIIDATTCRIMGYHNYNDTLAFTLVQPAPVPVQPVQPIPVQCPIYGQCQVPCCIGVPGYPPQQGPTLNNNPTNNNNITVSPIIIVPPPIVNNNNNNNITPSEQK